MYQASGWMYPQVRIALRVSCFLALAKHLQLILLEHRAAVFKGGLGAASNDQEGLMACKNPATGAILGTVSMASSTEVSIYWQEVATVSEGGLAAKQLRLQTARSQESVVQVAAAVAKARKAHEQWRETSFSVRRQLMRILNKAMLEHADTICKYGSTLSALDTMCWSHMITYEHQQPVEDHTSL